MTFGTITDVKQALDRYFGKLESGVMESNLSVNLLTYSLETEPTNRNLCAAVSTKKNPTHAPYLDSSTGMTIGDHALLQVLPESREDSFYMMQTIKIGSCEATIFFDPGANVNLINGALAQQAGLAVISSLKH